MALVLIITTGPPLGHRDWFRKEQATASRPMRLPSESLAGTTGEQGCQCGLPGVFRGYLVEKAFLKMKPTQRKAEVREEKKEEEWLCPEDMEMLDPAMPDPHHDFLEKKSRFV